MSYDFRQAVLIPTTSKSMLGKVYYMPLAKDRFVHFTTRERAEKIIASGRLLMNPPYKKSGIDAVNAVSVVWGWWVPRVQTTHLPPGELCGVLFTTDTPPEYGVVEEVVWKQDVHLKRARIVSFEAGIAALKKTPERLLDDSDEVTYKATHK